MEEENNRENSGPLTPLPVDRLTATDCNADRSCQNQQIHNSEILSVDNPDTG